MSVALLLALLALAQHAEHQPAPEQQKVQGVEPIRCWRQATSGAVTIGEPFRVILTCAIFESTDAQVVPDESRLNVASIQMAPFEIIGGTHPPDVRRGLRRFMQYEYEVRIISRDAIGQDVNVPPLTISYRIHSRVGAAAKLEGRDLSYVLPALPIKVLSLVPADAGDIRDASVASLATVDALRSRSRVLQTVAIALGVLAGAMVLFALVPLARRSRAEKTDRDVVPDRVVLGAAASSLRSIQRRAASDRWTDDDLVAALAAMRVIAAVATNRSISRKPLPPDGVTPEGRVRVDHGLIRRHPVSVSSAVTPADLDGHARLDTLRAAISLLSTAMYRRTPERDASAIDEAVRQAIAVAGDEASRRSRLLQGFCARDWLKTLWARR